MDEGPEVRDDARFLPVEIVSEPEPTAPAVETTGVIELELANGHRLRINGGYYPEAIGRLVQHLT